MSPVLANALRLADRIQADVRRKKRTTPTIAAPRPMTPLEVHLFVREVFREAGRKRVRRHG